MYLFDRLVELAAQGDKVETIVGNDGRPWYRITRQMSQRAELIRRFKDGAVDAEVTTIS
jgi:hypothetical protein